MGHATILRSNCAFFQEIMEQLQRIGISVSTELLDSFDELISRRGYTNRSEAIRDLIRRDIDSDLLEGPKARSVAAVFVVYDHHQSSMCQKLLQLQHNRLLESIASMHVHLDSHNCLEVILLKGKVSDIKKLADNIVSLKGVKLGNVNFLAAEE